MRPDMASLFSSSRSNISSNPPVTEDIVKKGYLRKKKQFGAYKTMTERFFVLRKQTADHNSRLEVYEHKQSFMDNNPPKKQYELKNCFYISKKDESPKFQDQHTIVIIIKEEQVLLMAQNEAEFNDWYESLREHHKIAKSNSNDPNRPIADFKHVWRVEVIDKGLATSNNLIGGRLVCLTNQSISLFSMKDHSIKIEIWLTEIRDCGCIREFFSLNVGRLAVTGSGELWMRTEDPYIAQSMNSTVFSAMAHYSRNRTQSFTESTSHTRPRERRNTLDSQKIRTVSESGRNEVFPYCISHKLQQLASGSLDSSRSNANKSDEAVDVVDGNSLHIELKSGNDSSTMASPASDCTLPSTLWESPTTYSSYLPMDPNIKRHSSNPLNKDNNEYVPMFPEGEVVQDTESSPLDITDSNFLKPPLNISPSSSAAHSRTSSIVDDCSNYLPMDPNRSSSISAPIPVSARANHYNSDPLSEMSPESGSSSFTSRTPSDQKLNELSEEGRSLSGDMFPDDLLPVCRTIRTSSVGSNPEHSKHKISRLEVGEAYRVRALSVGSKVAAKFVGPSRSSTPSSGVQTPVVTPSTEFAPIKDATSAAKNKSVSAPILGSSPISHSWSGPGSFFRKAIPTKSADRHSESDYMEFTTDKEQTDKKSKKKFELFKKTLTKNREKKKSEGEISRAGIAIPNGSVDREQNYSFLGSHSPRSHTSDGSDVTTPNGYMVMFPGRMDYDTGELNSSLSSSSSRDEYVIINPSNNEFSSSPPSVSSSSRTRKISTTLNPLDNLSSPSDEYMEFDRSKILGDASLSRFMELDISSQSNESDSSRKKSKKSNKRHSMKERKRIESLGRSQSDAEHHGESKSKSKGSTFLHNFFRIGSQNNNSKTPLSPQSSPVPKSNPAPSSPFSILTRSHSKENKESIDPSIGSRICPYSIQEDLMESQSAISKINHPLLSHPTYEDNEPYKVMVDNTRNVKRLPAIIDSSSLDQVELLATNKHLNLHPLPLPLYKPNEPINMLSKCSSPIVSSSGNDSYMNMIPSQNTPTSPLRRASTSWLPSPNHLTSPNTFPVNDSTPQQRRASTEMSPSLSNTSSPTRLVTCDEDRAYMNITPGAGASLVQSIPDKTHVYTYSGPSNLPVTVTQNDNNYLKMDYVDNRSNLKVLSLKKAEVPVLNVKPVADLKLDKLALNDLNVRPNNERARSHSGPGGNSQGIKPNLSVDTDPSKEGKASSACSSPVSHSPPTSPTLGSVSSMSSLSEGGLSSASSTCTVVNVGVARAAHGQSSLKRQLNATKDEQPNNYISLDLTPASSPKIGASSRIDRKSCSIASSSSSVSGEPTNYTQIDFVKSEGLHTTSQERISERQ